MRQSGALTTTTKRLSLFSVNKQQEINAVARKLLLSVRDERTKTSSAATQQTHNDDLVRKLDAHPHDANQQLIKHVL